MRRSLRNRLALAFFAITFVAIVVLYVYVAPGLRSRLISERLNELEAVATGTSGQIVRTVGSPDPLTQVVGKVDTAALRTGDRVTLLLVTHTSGGLQLSAQADSSNPGASAALPFTR